MSQQLPISIPGIITPDGTLELTLPQGLPAGPVEVSLHQSNGDAHPNSMPLPDEPIMDWAITAPCDLPLAGPSRPVTPIPGEMPLPDPVDETDIVQ